MGTPVEVHFSPYHGVETFASFPSLPVNMCGVSTIYRKLISS